MIARSTPNAGATFMQPQLTGSMRTCNVCICVFVLVCVYACKSTSIT